ncbi:MAG: ABC transporter permease subunit [Anaerolineaceae bacterium]|nr:ABC transporter permease subunit [Anaerolineaceae bacterium]
MISPNTPPPRDHLPAQEALNNAIDCYKRQDFFNARQWAIRAALLNPGLETPWLLLAAVVKPSYAIPYLQKVLEINPENQRAKQGLAWAEKEDLLKDHPDTLAKEPIAVVEQPESKKSFSSYGNLILKRSISSVLILLAIAFLTLLGIQMAQQGTQRLSIDFGQAILDALKATWQYIFQHPPTYYMHKEDIPAIKVVFELFLHSTGLLLFSLLIASAVGSLLGIIAALIRSRQVKPMMIFLSILGISTPSFLLAMLLRIVNVEVYQALGLSHAILPPTGFGWDGHIILPAIVLAARPMAQIMQVTYVSTQEVLAQDYIRSAKARGASLYIVVKDHVLKNILIPVLTTIGTSLRFSLASLPVVEVFFVWTGIGTAVLEAIENQVPTLITDLMVALGLLFLLINLLIELLYPRIDPRIQINQTNEEDAVNQESAQAPLSRFINEIISQIRNNIHQWREKRIQKKFEESFNTPVAASEFKETGQKAFMGLDDRRLKIIKIALSNPALMIGTILVGAFFVLAIFGKSWAPLHPFETHSIMTIEGVIQAPPFAPSSMFTWGTDPIGRDILSLILSGARQTFALAVLGMIARLVLGITIGMVAGWWQNSWLDRTINALIGVWAAFPITFFAMILIQALGIEKGMGVFVLTLCVVGWGEIAQYVRSQVIAQKPLLHIEAARSIGANTIQLLKNHIFPQLFPSLIVLSVMEIGSVLMLLAELGFLNVFMGGGFRAEIGETGRMIPVVYYFSDVPEWGAMLANIRSYWRSSPWMAWYPGMFFFIAILSFNVFGEGLRNFIEESKINISRLLNRYSVLAGIALLTIAVMSFQSNAPIKIYKEQAAQFDPQNVLADITVLSSSEFLGRESGSEVNYQAAQYIAQRMEEVGLFPAGEHSTFLQSKTTSICHIISIPILEFVAADGSIENTVQYRSAFTEFTPSTPTPGDVISEVVGLAASIHSANGDRDYVVRDERIENKIVIVRSEQLDYLNLQSAAGVLVIQAENDFLTRRYLYANAGYVRPRGIPYFSISESLANYILQSTGSSLAELDDQIAQLKNQDVWVSSEAQPMHMQLQCSDGKNYEDIYNVIGYIPGEDSMHSAGTSNRDNQVIMVSAYFDGLGYEPNGTLYPGANDNASGVAAMLEIARVLKQADYTPDKTVMFVAWNSGERYDSLSTSNILNASSGFALLTPEAVIELSGVGAGSGEAISIASGSSYRLIKLFEQAAEEFNYPITSRGTSPHSGLGARSSHGGRTALSAYLSWDGSDQWAHTPWDTVETINTEYLNQLGDTTTLVVTIISREDNY